MTKLQKLTKYDIQHCDARQVPSSLVDEFNRDTRDHTLTVLHDSGVYRHLRFNAPGHGSYAFEIISSLGTLTITGDMGSFTFCQTAEMFHYFRGAFKPERWATKVVNGVAGGRDEVSEFSDPAFTHWVQEDYLETKDEVDPGIAQQLKQLLDDTFLSGNAANIGSADEALWMLDELDLPDELGGQYADAAHSVKEWMRLKYHFVWCTAAILTGIRTFEAHQQEAKIAAAAERTPFKTGEVLEPKLQPNTAGEPAESWGKVDFDNEEGATVVTIRVEKSPMGYKLHTEQHSANPNEIISLQTSFPEPDEL